MNLSDLITSGVTTGDKGDITVSGSGATWTVDSGKFSPIAGPGSSQAFTVGAVAAAGSVSIAPATAAFLPNQLNAYSNGNLYITGGTNGLMLGATIAGTARMFLGYDIASASEVARFETNAVERMRITSGGSLLIGTIVDDGVNKLRVNGSGYFSGKLSVGTTDEMAVVQAGGTNTHLTIAAMGSAGVLRFGAGGVSDGTIGATRMTLDTHGNVAIGGIKPDNDYPARLWLVNADDCKMRVVKLGAVAASMSAVNSALAFGCDVAAGDTERMRISSTGNVLVGTTTDDGVNRLQVNGGITTQGIKFPSTQVASVDVNTLDDYEEGTWTPTATVGGVPVTCIGDRCTYTVVGNRVFVQGAVSVTAGSATGALKIYGFPFTLSPGTYAVASHWGIGEVAGHRSNIVFNVVCDMYIAGASGILGLSTDSGVPSTECIFIYNFHYIK